MEAGYTLYKHTAPNGKTYIGVTSRTVGERWANGNGYRGNSHFWKAIRKYGWESFTHEVLAVGLTKEEAEAKERELIQETCSFDRRRGYNLDMGGWSKGRASVGTKAKMSEAARLKWEDPEYRDKVTRSLQGRSFSAEHKEKLRERATGRKKTDEERELISSRVRGKNVGGTNPHARAVQNVNTGEKFSCVSAAAKWAGVCHSAISMACSGKRKSAGGYEWRWAQ